MVERIRCKNMKDTGCSFKYNEPKTIAYFEKLNIQPDYQQRVKVLQDFIKGVNAKSTRHNMGNLLVFKAAGNVPTIKIHKSSHAHRFTIPGLVRTLCHDYEEEIIITPLPSQHEYEEEMERGNALVRNCRRPRSFQI